MNGIRNRLIEGERGLRPVYDAEYAGQCVRFTSLKLARRWLRRRQKELAAMKKDEIKIGHTYSAKVSDRIVTVRIDSTNTHGGWNATNTSTGKRIRIKSAQRLRREIKPGRATEPAGSTPGEQGVAAAKAADKPNPTVEVGTGQPIPADAKPAKPRAAQKKTGGKPAEKKARTPKPATVAEAKRLSMLDAAAQVLREAAAPMRCKELIETIAARGLWSSPNGKTPEATLYAAMLREISNKGPQARFRKVDRGQFASAN